MVPHYYMPRPLPSSMVLQVLTPPAYNQKLTLQDRLKNADFERAMKLITARIDVRNDDRLMHLVFKEALANGAVEI